MSEILRAEGIEKRFLQGREELHVLKGIDLSLESGEIISITGPSGVGKSTFLHILGGLETPTTGKLYFLDEAIDGKPDQELAQWRNLNVGFVFQFHHLLPEFSALENVMMPAMIAGESAVRAADKGRELLDIVGLSGRLAHRPAELSGGEQQRVALARALVNGPRIVLADEPTGDLDEAHSRDLEQLIKSLNSERGITFLIVTHKISFAEEADRCFMMEDGRLRRIDT
jgi:lipoprotein-releasing system ATP-binding protein